LPSTFTLPSCDAVNERSSVRPRTANQALFRYPCARSGIVPDFGDDPMSARALGPLFAAMAFAVLGVAFTILGVSEFQRIHGMEEAGTVSGLGWRIEFVYMHVGKWGVFGLYEFLGMCFLIAAIDKTRAALRRA
jgi:hypothetical protein